MAERWVLLDKSAVYTYHPNGPRPIGTIGWDSNSGRPWGPWAKGSGRRAKKPSAKASLCCSPSGQVGQYVAIEEERVLAHLKRKRSGDEIESRYAFG